VLSSNRIQRDILFALVPDVCSRAVCCSGGSDRPGMGSIVSCVSTFRPIPNAWTTRDLSKKCHRRRSLASGSRKIHNFRCRLHTSRHKTRHGAGQQALP
jgi:hypothetical protein